MAIPTSSARTLVPEVSIEDVTTQARKTRCDVAGLAKTRRLRPVNAAFENGDELLFGTCDSRRVGGVRVLVNTNLAVNIDSFEELTSRIGLLRLKRLESVLALTILVAYAPTSSHDDVLQTERRQTVLFTLSPKAKAQPISFGNGFSVLLSCN
ncbi:hypothetical protein ANCDUO_02793 [Ancylostoma duodenale]|uniref:Uncharacterized protein n=1 Tax=Ancylostoma duodenale TaxID=51022 RepID=A0A0C2H5T0_9BILA|nr:hypothetical protein ANCDUO_02793 [Ancylostoma duodenale]